MHRACIPIRLCEMPHPMLTVKQSIAKAKAMNDDSMIDMIPEKQLSD